MKWSEYYDRFWDWADSTRVSRISGLEDFGRAEQIIEVIQDFPDEKTGARLLKHLLQNGARFSPEEILQMADYVTEDALCEAVRRRSGRFSQSEYETLEEYCTDQELLELVTREDLPKPVPVSFNINTQEPKKPGFWATLLGLGEESKPERGNAPGRGHPRHCDHDCAHCPAHYGYRYGRWYYGHHHSSGCEFGGNDCSGGGD